MSRPGYVVQSRGILHKHSCKCGQGSVNREPRSLLPMVKWKTSEHTSSTRASYYWCTFETGSSRGIVSVSSLVLLDTDLGPDLGWNFVEYTSRCPGVRCLDCSRFPRRAQGCPTVLICLLPSRRLRSEMAKDISKAIESFPLPLPLSYLAQSPRKMKVSSLYSINPSSRPVFPWTVTSINTVFPGACTSC